MDLNVHKTRQTLYREQDMWKLSIPVALPFSNLLNSLKKKRKRNNHDVITLSGYDRQVRMYEAVLESRQNSDPLGDTTWQGEVVGVSFLQTEDDLSLTQTQ